MSEVKCGTCTHFQSSPTSGGKCTLTPFFLENFPEFIVYSEDGGNCKTHKPKEGKTDA